MSTSEQTDAILRAAGDTLLQLGSEPPRRVPNTSLNASSLNTSVENYQKYLDSLELEIICSITEARNRAIQPQSNKVPAVSQNETDPSTGPLHMNQSEIKDENTGFNFDQNELDHGLDQNLDHGLDHGLDQDGLDTDLFDMNNDGIGRFGDPSPRQDFSIDDDFF